jgi:hypothetical protein
MHYGIALPIEWWKLRDNQTGYRTGLQSSSHFKGPPPPSPNVHQLIHTESDTDKFGGISPLSLTPVCTCVLFGAAASNRSISVWKEDLAGLGSHGRGQPFTYISIRPAFKGPARKYATVLASYICGWTAIHKIHIVWVDWCTKHYNCFEVFIYGHFSRDNKTHTCWGVIHWYMKNKRNCSVRPIL